MLTAILARALMTADDTCLCGGRVDGLVCVVDV